MEILALLTGLVVAAYALRTPLALDRRLTPRRSGRTRRWAPRHS